MNEVVKVGIRLGSGVFQPNFIPTGDILYFFPKLYFCNVTLSMSNLVGGGGGGEEGGRLITEAGISARKCSLSTSQSGNTKLFSLECTTCYMKQG